MPSRRGPRPGLRAGERPSLTCLRGSSPPWTPAAIPGCILYEGAYQESRATRNTAPNLLDGACEDVTKWTAGALTTKSNQLGGVVGKCMRVLNAGAPSRYVYQNGLLASGNRYAITGWARGDGTANPRVGIGSAAYEWTGTTSNAWQAISGNYDATSDALFLYATGADLHYAEFDSLTLSNLSLTSYAPQFTTVAGSVLAQATATAQPWVSSDGLGIRYASTDYLAWSAAASNVNCLHNGTGGTLVIAVRPNAVTAGDNTMIDTCNAADTTSRGMTLRYSSSGNVVIYVTNGSGSTYALEAYVPAPVAPDTTYVYVVRIASGANGVTIHQNNTLRYTGTLGTVSAGDATWGLRVGGVGIDGKLGHVGVYNRVVTLAEAQQITNFILAQATL